MARRHPRLAVVLALVLTVGGSVAAAETPDERLARAEREAASAAAEVTALDERAQEVAAALVGLRTRVADEEARLRALEGQLALAAGELQARRAALAEAEAEEDVARAELAAAEAELATQADVLSDRAAMAYMLGSDPKSAFLFELLTTAEDPGDVAVALELLEAATGYQGSVVRDVTDLRARQVSLAGAAREARRDAEDARTEAGDAVAFAEATRDQQAAVTARLETAQQEQQDLLAQLEQDAERSRVVLAAVETEVARAEAAIAAAAFGPVVPGATCPVVGARAGRDFSNDWGAPRPGGRPHEGTDVFATRGTPVLALAGGTVRALRRADVSLGGRYVSIDTGPAEHWYYAHLDEVAAGLAVGDVVAEGQQLGTVGNTGNARTTPPHLHIGFYAPGAVNPWPTLAQRC